MKGIYKHVTDAVIWLSILAIILGIILIAYPGSTLIAMGIMLGVYLVLQGINLIVFDIRSRRYYLPMEGMLWEGVLTIVFGVLLMIYPASLAITLGITIGIWLIVSGVSGIKTSLTLKNEDGPWVLMIILNVIDIVFGVIMFFAPLSATASITVLVGIALIVHSVIRLVDVFTVKKNVKELRKYVKGRFAEMQEEAGAIEAEVIDEDE